MIHFSCLMEPKARKQARLISSPWFSSLLKLAFTIAPSFIKAELFKMLLVLFPKFIIHIIL